MVAAALASLDDQLNSLPMVIYLTNPSQAEVKDAVAKLNAQMGYGEHFPYQKITVKFTKPTAVRVNRKKVVTVEETQMRFFDSKQGNFCYTYYQSTGYPVSFFDYRQIYSLSIFPENHDEDAPMLANKLLHFLNRFHPNAWQDYVTDPVKQASFTEENMRCMSIKHRLSDYVLERLQQAFEEKTNFHHHEIGNRRHWTVETKLGEDGIFRAYYSSEYVYKGSLCGNGDYWILINPTTAACKERD